MKITRAHVEEWAQERHLAPVHIEGILEGFSYQEAGPDGSYIAYLPLSEWEAVYAKTPETLLGLYNAALKELNRHAK